MIKYDGKYISEDLSFINVTELKVDVFFSFWMFVIMGLDTFFSSVFLLLDSVTCVFLLQRLSVQEVPPLLNGDSGRSQQQQRSPPSSQGESCASPDSPQTFHSLGSGGGSAEGSSCGASPQHVSPLPDSGGGPASSTSSTSGNSSQQSSLLLTTNTSNLSPSLIPSTVMSLSLISPSISSSMQGVTLPIAHSAPHSPPLPHSAPLSRAMTPVQLLHQQVGPGASSTLSHHPWLMKNSQMSPTATLPLPRRPVSEMRPGGFQGKMVGDSS